MGTHQIVSRPEGNTLTALKDRIVDFVNANGPVADNAAAMEAATRAKRAAFQSLMDSLVMEDYMAFHSALRSEIDDPVFDMAFKQALTENPQVAQIGMTEVIKGASVVSSRGSRPVTENLTSLFFIPVTGTTEAIYRLTEGGISMSSVERAMADSGLTVPEGDLAISDALLDPSAVVNASPATVRYLATAFDRFNKSGGTVTSHLDLEGAVDEFDALCAPSRPPRENAASCEVTLLLVGGYTREFDHTSDHALDGLTTHLVNEDMFGEYDDQMEAFRNLAEDAIGLKVGKPYWMGRACAAAAIQSIETSLKAEAAFYGHEGDIPFDSVSYCERGAVTMVEGVFAGNMLGPFAFDTAQCRLDPIWHHAAIDALALEIAPSGHMEHGRSAMLN